MHQFWYLILHFENVSLSFLLIKLVFECYIDFMLLLCWFDYYCCEIHASFIFNVIFEIIYNQFFIFFILFFNIIIMFNRDRFLIIRKLICCMFIRLFNVFQMNSNNFTLTINIFVFRFRFAKFEHHIIF